MKRPDVKKKSLAFIAEIDEAELALRLTERGIGLKRPKDGLPAKFHLEESIRSWPKECGEFPFGDMARIAIEYFRECIDAGQRPS